MTIFVLTPNLQCDDCLRKPNAEKVLFMLRRSQTCSEMKYFGSILEFTRQRNDDIMRAYRDCLQKAKFVVMPEIFAMVAESPASRFWVSEERAAIVVSAMLEARGREKHYMPVNGVKREMFEEIFRRFLLERKSRPKASVLEIVSVIVNQPAPKFYLTPRTIGEYIYRIKNGWYNR